MSRITELTDQLLIEPSKTQRLSVLQQQYSMKEIALEKATDLIHLLSDQLDTVRQSSFEIIEGLKNRLQEEQLKNRLLQAKMKEMEELIQSKESRIVGIPPLSRRSHSNNNKKFTFREESPSPNYPLQHFDFLKRLNHCLLSKTIDTYEQAEHLLQCEMEMIEEFQSGIQQHSLEMKELDGEKKEGENSITKGELFGIVQQQQRIILRLKSHLSGVESCVQPPLSLIDSTESESNLVEQLKVLLEIVIKCIRNKATSTRSSDSRDPRAKENQRPSEMVARIESLLSRERSLLNENKELKIIVQGLIQHVKK